MHLTIVRCTMFETKAVKSLDATHLLMQNHAHKKSAGVHLLPILFTSHSIIFL